jgi:hypothetical protein
MLSLLRKMTKLASYIVDKRDAETEISNLFGSYYEKYMRKLYKPYHLLKNRERYFQKTLIKIAKWSDEKRRKEHKQFIRWTKEKCHVSESSLQNWFSIYVDASINIMLFPNQSKHDYIFEKEVPSVKEFFYKCLKRVGRYYYDNPSLMVAGFENKSKRSDIVEIVSVFLTSFVPFDEIIKRIDVDDISSYDYPLSDHDSEEIRNIKSKLMIVKISDTRSDRPLSDDATIESLEGEHNDDYEDEGFKVELNRQETADVGDGDEDDHADVDDDDDEFRHIMLKPMKTMQMDPEGDGELSKEMYDKKNKYGDNEDYFTD